VFAARTSKTPLVTSAAQYVYVTEFRSYGSATQSCGTVPPVTCHFGFTVSETLPSADLGLEMHKHVFPYFGLNLSPTSIPPAPKWLFLNAGNPSVTVSKVNAGEFKVRVNFTFSVGSDGARWDANVCQQDTLSRDGFGLPGSHGCGASQISATAPYIG
jgi:hypothetical protein